jgi:hypothetical protein
VLGRLRTSAWWLLAVTSLVGCGGDSGGDDNGGGTGGSSGVETGGRGGSTPSGGTGTGGTNNDAGESGTAAGRRSAAGGSTTGGRSSSGGTPSGGRSQTGGAGPTGGEGEAAGTGSGGASGAEHCSPGKTYENFRAYEDAGGPISNCYGYDPTDVGQPADAEISVRFDRPGGPARSWIGDGILNRVDRGRRLDRVLGHERAVRSWRRAALIRDGHRTIPSAPAPVSCAEGPRSFSNS